MRGQWQPRTPLTSANLRAAQAGVRARKASAKKAATRAVVGRAEARRTNGGRALDGTCVDCGGPLKRPRHLRCEQCLEQTPGQSRDLRRRRGRAIAAAQAGLVQWRADHPVGERPPAEAFAVIREGLGRLKLTEIMAATRLSKSMASQIRSGRTVPHVRHWQALATLAAHAGREVSPEPDQRATTG